MRFHQPGETRHLGGFPDARPARPCPEDDDGRPTPQDLPEGQALPFPIGHAHWRQGPANRVGKRARQNGGGGRVQESAPLRGIRRIPDPPGQCAGLHRGRAGVGSDHRESKRRARSVAPPQPQFPQPPEEFGLSGLGGGRFKGVDDFVLETGIRQQPAVFDQSLGPGLSQDAGVFTDRLSERASGVSGEIHCIQIGHRVRIAPANGDRRVMEGDCHRVPRVLLSEHLAMKFHGALPRLARNSGVAILVFACTLVQRVRERCLVFAVDEQVEVLAAVRIEPLARDVLHDEGAVRRRDRKLE